MFFAPTLQSLDPKRVHILCLSTGNYDGLGDIRKELSPTNNVREMVESAKEFGIPASHVTVLDHPEYVLLFVKMLKWV